MKKILILTMILSGVVMSCKKVSAECKKENVDALSDKKMVLYFDYEQNKKELEEKQSFYRKQSYSDAKYVDSMNIVKKELEVLKTQWKAEDDKLASEISGLFDRCENLVKKGK